MTATTLGDLFPEMRTVVTSRERQRNFPSKLPGKSVNKHNRQGTADKLKALYPEIASWSPVLVTKTWFNWLRANQMGLVEPENRDERFPEYLVALMLSHMKETESWT
ncbi:hypothetical protein ACK6V0_23585 [Citrobacter braakii]|uniref:hypothetical protein n=1 Tax=Citrobacter braakii TaxID=57706 RepID=UPI003C2E981A